MKILALSDWHNDYVPKHVLDRWLAKADVVAVCGDMMPFPGARTLEEHYAKYAEWLRSLGKPVVFVPGNHDTPIDAHCNVGGDVHNLMQGPVEIHGVTFGGFWWNFCHDLPELELPFVYMTPYYEKIVAEAQQIPECDVIISHSPPRGILDKWYGRSIGAPMLWERAIAVGASDIICGHCHECGGSEEFVDPVRVTNVAQIATIVNIREPLVRKGVRDER